MVFPGARVLYIPYLPYLPDPHHCLPTIAGRLAGRISGNHGGQHYWSFSSVFARPCGRVKPTLLIRERGLGVLLHRAKLVISGARLGRVMLVPVARPEPECQGVEANFQETQSQYRPVKGVCKDNERAKGRSNYEDDGKCRAQWFLIS